jgi:hypothetical protein
MVVCLVLAGLRSGVADIVCFYFTHCSVRLNADHLMQVKHHTNLVEEQVSLLAILRGFIHKRLTLNWIMEELHVCQYSRISCRHQIEFNTRSSINKLQMISYCNELYMGISHLE